VHARFASELFGLPLNTPADPHASAFNERELYKIAAALFTWVFLDADPAASFQLRQTARTATSSLTSVLKPICSALKDGDFAMGLRDVLVKDNGPMKAYGRHMLQRILQGKTVDYALGQIIPTITASVANQAQGVTGGLHPPPPPPRFRALSNNPTVRASPRAVPLGAVLAALADDPGASARHERSGGRLRAAAEVRV